MLPHTSHTPSPTSGHVQHALFIISFMKTSQENRDPDPFSPRFDFGAIHIGIA